MRTICITGATTGIGGAIARAVVGKDRVFLHYYRKQDICDSLARELKDRGAEVYTFQGDFAGDPDGSTAALAELVGNHAESLEVLVNNAGGIIRRQNLGEVEYDVVAKTVNLNLVAPMMLTSRLTPLLKAAERADVINITSVAARSAIANSTSYGASKAGLENYTRGAAKALAPTVRVNSISPGIIDTPFHEITPREQLEKFRMATPLQVYGRPEDVAGAVQFLLDNRYTTGSVVAVNGGMMMT